MLQDWYYYCCWRGFLTSYWTYITVTKDVIIWLDNKHKKQIFFFPTGINVIGFFSRIISKAEFVYINYEGFSIALGKNPYIKLKARRKNKQIIRGSYFGLEMDPIFFYCFFFFPPCYMIIQYHLVLLLIIIILCMWTWKWDLRDLKVYVIAVFR